ncbi:MAG: glycosyltransferase family 39 protein [Vicinamibacterales bacterium]
MSRPASAGVLRGAAPALAALAITVFLVAVARNGSFVAAGADAYGYVSQADLWARGTVRQAQPVAHAFPPNVTDEMLAPLGYRPARIVGLPGGIVPTYSPGLPLLMAAASRIAGRSAVFAVVPILAALTLWWTYRIGTHLASPWAGLLACIALATSPTFFSHAVQPMSDVPVTCWWLFALWQSARGTRRAALIAGVGATAAVLTRPNLVLLVVPLALGHVVDDWRRKSPTAAEWRTPPFLAAALAGPVIVAAINTHLYKSPLTSGYGSLADIYSTAHFWPNLARYPTWLIEVETPLLWLAPLAVALGRREPPPGDAGGWSPRLVTVVGLAQGAAVAASYFWYLPFDHWSYLRFVLPVFPVTLAAGAATVTAALGRSAPRWTLRVLLIVTTGIGISGVETIRRLGVPDWHVGLSRYRTVGEYVATGLPSNAVLFAMEHSGSVRYYGKRPTVRYDVVAADDLDSIVDGLRMRGFRAYLVVDDWEESAFTRQFAQASRYADLTWPPVAAFEGEPGVRIFALDAGAEDRGDPPDVR